MEKNMELLCKFIVIVLTGILLISLFMLSSEIGYAADIEGPGQNVGEWVIEQAFWIALAVISVVAISFVLKRSWVALGIFMVISAIVLIVIKNPERLTNLGNVFFELLGL